MAELNHGSIHPRKRPDEAECGLNAPFRLRSGAPPYSTPQWTGQPGPVEELEMPGRNFSRHTLAAKALIVVALAGVGPGAAQDFGERPDWGYGLTRRYLPEAPRPAWDGGRWFGWDRERRDGLLPPRAIVGSLYRQGYRDVAIRRLRGPNY